MLLDICLGNKSVWRILLLYAESPGAGFIREDIREHTGMGNRALTMALKRLVSFRILKGYEKDYPYTVYKLNMDNKYTELLLSLLKKEREDLNYLPLRYQIIIRNFTRKVVDKINPEKVYLFGSVAKRTYREDSDIDIAVIVKDKKPEQELILSKLSENRIQTFIFSQEEFKDSTMYEDIVKHGIRIL